MSTRSLVPWLLIAFLASAWWLDSRGAVAQDTAPKDSPPKNSGPKGKVYQMEELERERAEKKRSYLSFLKVPSLSTGLYVLEAGAKDGQSPHGRDEIYYVVAGKGKIIIADETWEVREGSVIYVKAGVAHRFLDIEKTLSLLVVFAGS